MKVQTTKINQEENKLLKTPARTLYYLILGDGENQYVVNVGQKTHDKVNELIKTEGGKK